MYIVWAWGFEGCTCSQSIQSFFTNTLLHWFICSAAAASASAGSAAAGASASSAPSVSSSGKNFNVSRFYSFRV